MDDVAEGLGTEWGRGRLREVQGVRDRGDAKVFEFAGGVGN